jgi:hypothetical protein
LSVDGGSLDIRGLSEKEAAARLKSEREVLNAARDRHQHWELTTEVMPAALLGEPCPDG